MKKYVISLAVVASLLLVAGPVLAQESSTSPSPSTRPSISPRPKVEMVKNAIKIKDEKKRKNVENIVAAINQANQKTVRFFGQSLDRLDRALAIIITTIEKRAAKGADVTAARSAIDVAKTAIATSRAAVKVQGEKVYTLEVTSEGKVTGAVGTLRKQLETDLRATRETVKAAEQAVRDANQALRNVIKPKSSESPSPSATPDDDDDDGKDDNK